MIANFIVELKLKFAIIKKYIIDVTMFIDILTIKFVSSMIYIFIITNFSFNSTIKFAYLKKYIIDVTNFIDILTINFVLSMIYLLINANLFV